MRCGEIGDRLTPCFDGELAAPDRRGVEAHVAECAACRAAVERMERLGALLAEAPLSPLPAGFAERVAAAAAIAIGLGAGMFMGRATWPGGMASSAGGHTAGRDPLAASGLDGLAEVPGGSIEEAYLSLAMGPNAKEK